MKIRVLKEEEIDDKLDAVIRDRLVFSFPNSQTSFKDTRNWRDNVPLFSVVMGDENDDIIAHLAVADKTILVGTEQLRIAGIANIFVMPDFRNRGYVGKILSSAMNEAKMLEFDFSLLFTGQETKKVYARYGWIEIIGQKCIIDKNGEESEMLPDSVPMYYPLTNKDFPVGTIYLQGDTW